MSAAGRRRLLLAAALVLGGCGGTPEQETAPPTEQQSLDRSARLAFDQGQYAQAATLYQAALGTALAQDAALAIIDARYNLALCQTYLGAYDAALDELAQAEAERQRRGLPVDAQLPLLAGTVHYRRGELERAAALLTGVLNAGTASAATLAKAHFVAGLIAADRTDAAALRTHVAALPAEADGADRLELQGRLLALEGDLDGAVRLLEQTAELRSRERDYRGVARALASAGELSARAGRTRAGADYLFRAGRSAAQRQQPQARAWLRRAGELAQLAGDAALRAEADAVLRSLETQDEPAPP